MRLAQLLAVFAATSAFSDRVNTTAVIFPLLFFGIAIVHYINLGLTTGSNNSLRDSPDKAKDYLILNYPGGIGNRRFYGTVSWFFSTLMGLKSLMGESVIVHDASY